MLTDAGFPARTSVCSPFPSSAPPPMYKFYESFPHINDWIGVGLCVDVSHCRLFFRICQKVSSAALSLAWPGLTRRCVEWRLRLCRCSVPKKVCLIDCRSSAPHLRSLVLHFVSQAKRGRAVTPLGNRFPHAARPTRSQHWLTSPRLAPRHITLPRTTSSTLVPGLLHFVRLAAFSFFGWHLLLLLHFYVFSSSKLGSSSLACRAAPWLRFPTPRTSARLPFTGYRPASSSLRLSQHTQLSIRYIHLSDTV